MNTLEQIKLEAYNKALSAPPTSNRSKERDIVAEAQMAVAIAVMGYWSKKILECQSAEEKAALIEEAIASTETSEFYVPPKGDVC